MNDNINKIQDKIDQLGEIQPWNHNFELLMDYIQAD